MNRVVSAAKAIALVLLCYVVFGTLGEYSALGFFNLSGVTDVGGWFVYSASLLVAIGAVVWTLLWYRSGRSFRPVARVGLAGFVAFFVWQWTIAGVPDWNPLPILASTILCWGAALTLLRTSRPARAF